MSRVYGRAGMRIGQGLLFIGQMGGGAVLRNDEPPASYGLISVLGTVVAGNVLRRRDAQFTAEHVAEAAG